jgi:translation initiation factor IF-1
MESVKLILMIRDVLGSSKKMCECESEKTIASNIAGKLKLQAD